MTSPRPSRGERRPRGWRCAAAICGIIARDMAVQRSRIALLFLASLGCPEEPPPVDVVPVRLAKPEGWVRVLPPATDVFAAMRPPDATCDDVGYRVDPLVQSFEVQTGVCDYLTVRQPTLEPLEPGDVVSVRAFHYDLVAPTPSEGYLGFALDGVIVWEVREPIPGPPSPLNEDIVIDRALPAGAEMQLHIHNHGENTWELLSVMVTPAD